MDLEKGFPWCVCVCEVNVAHSVYVQVKNAAGDIFHTPHIKVQIFDLE